MNRGLSFLLFLTIGLFIFVEINVFRRLERFKNKVEVRILLKNRKSAKKIKKKLIQEKGIKEFTFLSQNYALKEFERRFGINHSLFTNYFPSSFKIILAPKYITPEYLSTFSKKMREIEGVEEVVYPERYIQNIWKINEYWKWGSYGIGGLLFLLTTFTLWITLHLRKIYIKRKSEAFVSSKIRFGGIVLIENIIISGIAIGCVYCFYHFVLVKLLSNIVFLSPNYIIEFIGGCGVLSFIISMTLKN
jgi:hypothetical protein